MERRKAIRYLFIMAGGVAVLPSCLRKESKSSLLLKNISFSLDEENTLAEFAETLIPASATPGAKDTYAHLYVMRMLDDCSEKEEQQDFTKGLKSLESLVKEKHKTNFLEATPAQREDIVRLLDGGQGPVEAQSFYKLMKRLTIQGYLTSKPVMGDIFKYELVPGRYEGAYPLKAIIRQV